MRFRSQGKVTFIFSKTPVSVSRLSLRKSFFNPLEDHKDSLTDVSLIWQHRLRFVLKNTRLENLEFLPEKNFKGALSALRQFLTTESP